MRDIKFRAWRKCEMYEGLCVEKLLAIAAKTGFGDSAISPAIWMQYTGLKDRNGVEIYEGDIFFDGIENCTIEWCDESASFVANDGTEKHDLGGWTNHEVVIGNIHQNPELLEGKK